MINYIDSAELAEVLSLEIIEQIGTERENVKHYIEVCLIGYSDPLDKLNIRRIRAWLDMFIKNPNCIGASNNYKHVWKAILQTEEDDCFLKLVAANIYLMWD